MMPINHTINHMLQAAYYYNRFTALWILSGTGKANLDFTEARDSG